MNNIVPKFQTEPATGTYDRVVVSWVPPETEKGRGKFVRTTVTEPRGVMAYLPNGACVHIAKPSEIARLQLNAEPRLVDLDSSEEFDAPRAPSLKTRAMRKSRNGPVDLEVE